MNTYTDPVRDLVVIEDHFFGLRNPALTASVVDGPWSKADTSASGSPTVTSVTPSDAGEIALTFDSTNEIQNLCLYWGDKLGIKLANLQRVYYRAKLVTALTAANKAFIGIGSGRNDDSDSITYMAGFKIDGNNNVGCESDDNTTDLDDKATGYTLLAAHKWFCIDFSPGLADVHFFMGDSNKKLARVCQKTTFNMSQATGSIQPIIQFWKSASTNVDALTLDYFRAELKMSP